MAIFSTDERDYVELEKKLDNSIVDNVPGTYIREEYGDVKLRAGTGNGFNYNDYNQQLVTPNPNAIHNIQQHIHNPINTNMYMDGHNVMHNQGHIMPDMQQHIDINTAALHQHNINHNMYNQHIHNPIDIQSYIAPGINIHNNMYNAQSTPVYSNLDNLIGNGKTGKEILNNISTKRPFVDRPEYISCNILDTVAPYRGGNSDADIYVNNLFTNMGMALRNRIGYSVVTFKIQMDNIDVSVVNPDNSIQPVISIIDIMEIYNRVGNIEFLFSQKDREDNLSNGLLEGACVVVVTKSNPTGISSNASVFSPTSKLINLASSIPEYGNNMQYKITADNTGMAIHVIPGHKVINNAVSAYNTGIVVTNYNTSKAVIPANPNSLYYANNKINHVSDSSAYVEFDLNYPSGVKEYYIKIGKEIITINNKNDWEKPSVCTITPYLNLIKGKEQVIELPDLQEYGIYPSKDIAAAMDVNIDIVKYKKETEDAKRDYELKQKEYALKEEQIKADMEKRNLELTSIKNKLEGELELANVKVKEYKQKAKKVREERKSLKSKYKAEIRKLLQEIENTKHKNMLERDTVEHKHNVEKDNNYHRLYVDSIINNNKINTDNVVTSNKIAIENNSSNVKNMLDIVATGAKLAERRYDIEYKQREKELLREDKLLTMDIKRKEHDYSMEKSMLELEKLRLDMDNKSMSNINNVVSSAITMLPKLGII